MGKSDSQYEKMTKTPVSKLVIKLGIPTTISMLVTNIYNMVDTMFVGKLGTSASGAVGIVFGFMAVVQAFGFMFGQGAGSIISRMLGARKAEDATRIASTSFFVSIFTGVIMLTGSLIFINPLMYLLGSTDTIFPYARAYVFYIILAAPFMISTFVMNNILRYEGRASLAMIGLLSGAIINMALDPLLMFVMHMGIAGAGLSTALSQCISFCILLYMFLSGRTQSRLSIFKVSRDVKDVADIVATGFPSFVRQGLSSFSTMLLNNGARIYGDSAVSAMSIVNRITMFVFSAGLGVGQGFQPVCGFNYGAGKYERVKKAFRFTLIISECMLGSVAIVTLLLSGHLIKIFRDDPDVIRIGTTALRYYAVGLFVQPFCVLANMTLQSTGHKFGATFLSMLRSGLYFIPIFLLFSNIWGLFGIQTAQPFSDLLAFFTAIPFMMMFFKKLPHEKEIFDT